MMENLPILVLVTMVSALLVWPTRMMTVTATAALVTLILSGNSAPELLRRIAPNLLTVLVVMSATQLAVKRILQGGAGGRISVAIATLAAHRVVPERSRNGLASARFRARGHASRRSASQHYCHRRSHTSRARDLPAL